ncbi:D-hexose-6-phosphate mutarotase [Eionea flava]
MSLANTISALYADYGQLKGVTIECQKELVAIGIKNQAATAEVFLQGAQVTRYQPNNSSPFLFLSDACDYQSGQALRGGIPICWPWFGLLDKNPSSVRQSVGFLSAEDSGSLLAKGSLPAHGFVRERDWSVTSIRTPADNLTIIELSYHVTDEPLWPFNTLLSYRIAIGKTLSVSLHVHNQSDKALTYSGALHSYLSINDIAHTRVSGLDGCHYYDALESDDENNWLFKQQEGDIVFSQETDRVYQTTGGAIQVRDGDNRVLELTSSGSKSAVVWNPWLDKARTLSQFTTSDYTRMLCIETANAVDDVVTLAPDASHRIELTFSAL